MVTHQSHDGDAPGQTDSAYKLTRLKLPADLSGLRVLDIGCNEGYFCNAAVQRGAASVLGIDMDERFLAEAGKRYPHANLAFAKRPWSDLPAGPFDMILWTSAMHYELDPASVLRNIARILSPNGLFVLECGVVQSPRKEMVYSVRHDGGLWYPTQLLLENFLEEAGFAFRVVSHPELVGTDPVPRSVFHIRRRVPSVILVTGESQKGKSNIAQMLSASATKIVELDYFVSRISSAKWAVTPLQKFIKENLDPTNLKKLYDLIDSSGFTEDYAALLAKNVAQSDQIVIFDGYITSLQIKTLQNALSKRARVWELARPHN